jgi:hypothetical protein
MQIRWQNPYDYFDQIYYINLDKRTDRKELAELELRDEGIKAVRVPGVVHENPAHGCHLSHAKILYDAIYNGFDRILIFEDDVQFFQDSLKNIRNALEELPPNWEMFYLGANLDAYPAYEISPHIAKLTGAFATHAYAIRHTLFHVLYEINSSLETSHNDVVYANTIHPVHNCYLAMPLIAGQRDSYSDIEKIVMRSNSVFKERLEKNLIRK